MVHFVLQDLSTGLHYTDVKQLHRRMLNEVNSLRGVGITGQKQSLLEVDLYSLSLSILPHVLNSF